MLDRRKSRPPFPLQSVLAIVAGGLSSLTVAQVISHRLGRGGAGDWIALSVGLGVGLAFLAVLRDGEGRP